MTVATTWLLPQSSRYFLEVDINHRISPQLFGARSQNPPDVTLFSKQLSIWIATLTANAAAARAEGRLGSSGLLVTFPTDMISGIPCNGFNQYLSCGQKNIMCNRLKSQGLYNILFIIDKYPNCTGFQHGSNTMYSNNVGKTIINNNKPSSISP